MSDGTKGKESHQNEKLLPLNSIQRMVCFDFDLTLSSHRVYGRRDFDRLVSMLFGGEKRVSLLREFFSFLSLEHNVRIVVISWNFEDIILDALEAVGLSTYVHKVFDRPHLIAHGGYQIGKRNIVEGLCKTWSFSSDQVVFVDDSAEVLRDMSCHTVWVQTGKGIQLREMKRISNALGLVFHCDGRCD